MSDARLITERLTDLRRAARLSRARVAAQLGIRTQHLQMWETGGYVPSSQNAAAWAAALGCALVVQPRAGLPVLGACPAQALAAARRRRGLSQAQVAAAAGFSQPQLSQWERQGHVPGLQALVDWADVLGCDLVLVPAAVMAVAA